MKKILTSLTVVCLFSVGAAFAADDGESLFQANCQGCHGADGSRVPPNAAGAVKGLGEDQILKMLSGYKDGSFGGKSKQVMKGVVSRLSDDQLKSVAGYAAKL